MYKLLYVMLAVLLLSACSPTPPKKYLSPSKNYFLYVSINTNKSDAGKYKCVHLALYDNVKGTLLDSLQTGASDNSTWAVGWHTVNDTIVLNSKDIGNYAYSIDEHRKLKKLKNYAQLNHLADSVFSKKY